MRAHTSSVSYPERQTSRMSVSPETWNHFLIDGLAKRPLQIQGCEYVLSNTDSGEFRDGTWSNHHPGRTAKLSAVMREGQKRELKNDHQDSLLSVTLLLDFPIQDV